MRDSIPPVRYTQTYAHFEEPGVNGFWLRLKSFFRALKNLFVKKYDNKPLNDRGTVRHNNAAKRPHFSANSRHKFHDRAAREETFSKILQQIKILDEKRNEYEDLEKQSNELKELGTQLVDKDNLLDDQYDSCSSESEKQRILVQKRNLKMKFSEAQNRYSVIEDELGRYEEDFSNFSPKNTVKAMISSIIKAVDTGNFDTKFIENLCAEIVPDIGHHRMIQESFRRMSVHKGALKTFNETVWEYLDKLSMTQNASVRRNIQNRLDLFIYNTFVPPYQKGDGSCFTSALLMKLWHDSPAEYLKVIHGILEHNEVDLRFLRKERSRGIAPVAINLDEVELSTINWTKVSLINVENFGEDDDQYDMVNQKLISALAPLSTSFIKNRKKVLASRIAHLCSDIGECCAKMLGARLVQGGILWSHGWIPVCAWQRVTESEIAAVDRLSQQIESILREIKRENPDIKISNPAAGCDGDPFKMLAYRLVGNPEIKIGGGNMQDVMQNAIKVDDGSIIEATITPPEGYETNAIFSAKNIRKLSRILKYGTTRSKKSKPKKLCVGQFISGFFTHKAGGGHAFNFLAGYYDFMRMQIGEMILVGHTNYPDGFPKDGFIFVKRISENEFQLVRSDGQPITKDIDELTLYSNFMVQYQ